MMAANAANITHFINISLIYFVTGKVGIRRLTIQSLVKRAINERIKDTTNTETGDAEKNLRLI